MIDAAQNMTASELDKSEEEATASETLTAAEIDEHHYSAQTGEFLAAARGEVLDLIQEVRRPRTELEQNHMAWLTTEHIAEFIAGLSGTERRKLFNAILEQYFGRKNARSKFLPPDAAARAPAIRANR